MKHRKHRSSRGASPKDGGFCCLHCKGFVVINSIMGTANRNHCNMCLWSRHVDITKGDRRATCRGGMRPVGLTFKHEGHGRIGELMLIHLCLQCAKLSINRLARDDSDDRVLDVFTLSQQMDSELYGSCQRQGIYVLAASDELKLRAQLFGAQRARLCQSRRRGSADCSRADRPFLAQSGT